MTSNWLLRLIVFFQNWIFSLVILLLVLPTVSCGVRGPPVAPKDPPWIGSGRPQYFEPPVEPADKATPQKHPAPVRKRR